MKARYHLPFSLGAALLANFFCGLTTASTTPIVNISMNAAFPAPPYLVELLESAASENETAYFPILDRIAEGFFAKKTTDKELYDTFLGILKDDGLISSPESLSTFKLALSMRSSAPRIEAHYQFFETAVEPAITESKEDCREWVLFGGKQYCSPSLEIAQAEVSAVSPGESMPFDRVLGAGPRAILYADITSPNFAKFHHILSQKAKNGEISYEIRYRRNASVGDSTLPISGYGVELALKKTDYIVIDDRDSGENSVLQDTGSAQVALESQEEVSDLKPLSSSELSRLGLSAASFIAASENPMDTLLKVTQDFPKYLSLISSHKASESFLEEYQANLNNMIPAGYNMLWMNGVQLIERQIESFTLVDLLRKERKLIDAIRALGLSGTEAISLLSHEEVTTANDNDQETRFDWRDDLEGGHTIMWLNNIEKDDRYSAWSKDLYTLLRPMMPGQLPPVRRDMFNLVVPIDFSSSEHILLVTDQLWLFVERVLPIQFGLVPLVQSETSKTHAKIAYHILKTYGPATLMKYLRAIYSDDNVKEPTASLFNQCIEDEVKSEINPVVFSDILGDTQIELSIGRANAWISRLNGNSATPPAFVNGVAVSRTGRWMNLVSQQIGHDLQIVQQRLYRGTLDNTVWVPEFFLQGALNRRNSLIIPSSDNPLRIIDVHKMRSDHSGLFSKLPIFEPGNETTKEHWASLTVIADLNTDSGRNLLVEATLFRQNNPGIRMDVIHNPASSSGASKVSSSMKSKEADFLEVSSRDSLDSLLQEGEQDDAFDIALIHFLDDTSMKPGTQNLMLNGRLVGPIDSQPPFFADDFQQLFEFEQAKRILPVYRAVDALGIGKKIPGPLGAAKLTSVTAISGISDLPEGIFEQAAPTRTNTFNNWKSHHVFFSAGDPTNSAIHLTALLNPASEQAQRWVPLLRTLAELDGVYLKIFMNPKQRLDELPVKRFFRFVLEPAPRFDENGMVRGLAAEFRNVPSEALLTAGLNIPPAWLVAPKVSTYDLDNIKLSSVKNDVIAIYELENILIEGHSREITGQAPRGAQLVLATEKEPHFSDTIIMANLGYFQFKANPGFYRIKLKGGHSRKIYEITSLGAHGPSAAIDNEGEDSIVLMDFQGTTLYPRLKRRPGMEEADVLDEDSNFDSEPIDIIGKSLKFAASIFGNKDDTKESKSMSNIEHAEINIFSVASGHLYERMLNIMTRSVMEHTNHTVKFWFIEQFLSPNFKNFLPELAKELGFRYEMVTYRWPHWLRSQKEKQREIWGYKILFLDVLFPLSLDKVIFVDADQIVRTDMIELVKTDLHGAPYGFTPMCDSRTEMEGFRFWKQGYWANYLRGKPYHISALYVVDLKKFRQMAAGDRLRQNYHSLSADPNSLSNLDQDLPNHMQHQLPIYSLSQEWLWCETWCSDESLAEARTIDLCNNPMTKEPKLDRARRQVPEWTVYDDEITAIEQRWKASQNEIQGQRRTTPQDALDETETNSMSRRLEEPHLKDEL